MRLKSLLLSLGLLLLASAPAWAGSVTFNFNSYSLSPGGPFVTATSSTDLGSNIVFFQSTDTSSVLQGFSIFCSGGCAATTFAGFEGAATAPDLFYKFTSGDPSETGLGLAGTGLPGGNQGTGDSDNEIGNNYAIIFSLPPSGFTAPFSTVAVVGSVQGGETFVINGQVNSGTGTQLFTETGGGVDVAMLPGADGFPFLGISAPSGDVLIDSVTFSTVPEPASLALFGTALLLLGGLALRRRALVG